MLTALLFLAFNVVTACPVVTPEWVARYTNHTVQAGACARVIRVDTAGNVYVAGTADGAGTGMDFVVVKYNAAGRQLWEARHSNMGVTNDWIYGDVLTDLTVDSAGNVYVTGSGRDLSDYATLKYDPNGHLLWLARYAAGFDLMNGWAEAIAVDNAGNVYVTGHSIGSIDTGEDIATVKYDRDGRQLWAERFSGPGRWWDHGDFIAVDPAGNVFVGGISSLNSDESEFIVLKYSGAGRLLWIAHYRPAGEIGSMWTAGMALDRAGNVYLAGTALDPRGLDPNYCTVKFDPDGGVLWAVGYDGPVHRYDFAGGLALDGEGNVIVTGTSVGTLDWTSNDGDPIENFLTVKYNAHGQLLWTAREPVTGLNGYVDVAVDRANNVCISGISRQSRTGDDYLTIQYHPGGQRRWTARFNDPQPGVAYHGDSPFALAVDGAGNVLVTGCSDGDFATVKYVPGDIVCPPIITKAPQSQTRLVGQMATFTVEAEGTPPLRYQWWFKDAPITGATNATFSLSIVNPDQAGAYSVVISGPGGAVTSEAAALVVAPVPSGPGSVDITFDPTAQGEVIGLEGDGAGVFALALQPDGKVIVGGKFAGFDDAPRRNIARLNANGLLDHAFNSSGNTGEDMITAIALQSDGKVVLAGSVWKGGARGPYLARLNADGTLDQSFMPQLPTAYWGGLNFVVIQPAGKIFTGGGEVIGIPGGESASGLLRLNTDGSIDASFRPAVDGVVNCGALQPDGKILVGSATSAENRLVVRLNPDGTRDNSFLAHFRPAMHWVGVSLLALQPDGKVIIQGLFSVANADGTEARRNFARLNADGSVDATFSGGGFGQFISMLLQPDGRILAAGFFSSVGSGVRLVRFLSNGLLDSAFVADPEVTSLSMLVRALALRPDGQLLVGRDFDSSRENRSVVSLLHTNGSLNSTFRSHVNLTGASVFAVLPQSDGKAVIGGDFSAVNGESRPRLARLNADGTLDPTFAPVFGPIYQIQALAQQADGKIIVGGSFEVPQVGGFGDLARLNPDGSLDESFQLDTELYGVVFAVATQPDGKMVAAGRFDIANEPHCCLARFLPDGRLDRSFTPGVGPQDVDTGLRAIALQPDGKILTGGESLTYNGVPRILARLNPDGALDTTFSAEPESGFFSILDIAVQPDGKILVGGGSWRNSGVAGPVKRLNFDGTIDGAFDATWLSNTAAETLVLQPDGKIIVGRCCGYAGTEVTTPNLVRLNPDGTWDRTFASDVNGSVYAVATQSDGQILIGGSFNLVNGIPREGIARLNNDLPSFESFVRREFTGTRVDLFATPPVNISVYAVQDQPPANWPVTEIADGGVFDRTTGRVKFGPFYDHEPRTLGYRVAPPAGAHGVFGFIGTASADGVNSLIGGDSTLVLPGSHPADLAPIDWHLDISEVTAYGAAWRRGETWPTPPNPIPIDYLTRAAALWQGGECYTVDGGVTNEPLWWVNCDSDRIAGFLSPVSQVVNPSTARRQMADAFVPGEPLLVTLSISPGTARGHAVEDVVPAGWIVSAISDGGEFDATHRKVKWGPFFDLAPRTLTYTVLPPAHATREAAFTGAASFDGQSVVVGGASILRVGCRLALERDAATGNLTMRAFGQTDTSFALWISHDLRTWTPLGVTITNGQPIPFEPRIISTWPQTFYRVQPIR